MVRGSEGDHIIVSGWVVLAVAGLIAVAWWLVFLIRGIEKVKAAGILLVIIGFIAIQIIGWLAAAGILRRSRRRQSAALATTGLIMAVLLVLGNVAYFLTPVVGAAVLLIAIFVGTAGFLATIGQRRFSSKASGLSRI